jgi:hypothetical protein
VRRDRQGLGGQGKVAERLTARPVADIAADLKELETVTASVRGADEARRLLDHVQGRENGVHTHLPPSSASSGSRLSKPRRATTRILPGGQPRRAAEAPAEVAAHSTYHSSASYLLTTMVQVAVIGLMTAFAPRAINADSKLRKVCTVRPAPSWVPVLQAFQDDQVDTGTGTSCRCARRRSHSARRSGSRPSRCRAASARPAFRSPSD